MPLLDVRVTDKVHSPRRQEVGRDSISSSRMGRKHQEAGGGGEYLSPLPFLGCYGKSQQGFEPLIPASEGMEKPRSFTTGAWGGGRERERFVVM